MAAAGNSVHEGSSEEGAPPSLSQLFLRGWEARRRLDACELTARSPEYSACVAEGVAALERATELASHASLFSDNEELEELPTSSLKYLLLPALLGELTLLKTEGERIDTVHRARVYFVDYLRRGRAYGVTREDPPPAEPQLLPTSVGVASSEPPRKTYDQLVSERAVKVQRYKEKRELERRTEELASLLNVGGQGGCEEGEGGRDEWVAMLQLNVHKSREFVSSIDDEIPILRHMEAVRKGEEPVAKKPEVSASARQPAKTIVITREMLRGEVFGAGYPSLPTMTVEEFHQQRYGGQGGEVNGDEVKGGEVNGGEVKEGEVGDGENGEEEEEEESEESLKAAREWDEFKDENRRGWGNKENMG